MDESRVILKLENITKRFPGTLALDHVQLKCEKGKVHILLGENGAGKSTLVKIISGVYKRDEGTMWYDGREVSFTGVRQSMDAGISIIHQELNLLPERTIAQNIYLGNEPMVKGMKGVVDYKKMIRDSEAILFALFGIVFDEDNIHLDLSFTYFCRGCRLLSQSSCCFQIVFTEDLIGLVV